MDKSGETYLIALATHVAKQVNLYDVELAEAIQIAVLAGLQHTRTAEQSGQRPKRCHLIQWMRKSLMRFSRANRYQARRENSTLKLPRASAKEQAEMGSEIDRGDASVSKIEANDYLAAHLPKLTCKQRVAITLVYLRGNSAAEAARQLGISHKSIHYRIKAGLQRLRGTDETKDDIADDSSAHSRMPSNKPTENRCNR